MTLRPPPDGSSRAPITLFATHAAGGIMELWESLAEGLEQRGQASELRAIYCVEGEPGFGPKRAHSPWRYLFPRTPRGLADRLRMFAALCRWLRREQPALILCAMHLSNVLVPLLARILSPRTRIVLTHHQPAFTRSRTLDRIDSLTGCLANVHAIVSVAPVVERSLAHKPPAYRARCTVITNALSHEMEALTARLAQEAAARVPDRCVISTGRLAEVKNFGLLVRAAPLIPGVTVRIVGEGEERPALEALIRELGVGDRVELTGQREREETLRLVARSAIFAQISHSEGHSLSLIEAARIGLPLVVSDIPAQRDAVAGENGAFHAALVPTDDPAALAAAILALLDDPAALAKAREGSAMLARRWTFDAMLNRYETVIDAARQSSR